VFCAQIALSEA